MPITDGIDVTPQSTLSTIQFENEVLNTIITSLLTSLVIANLVSVINRLVLLSRHNVFSYRAFARSYVFLNSDDPLRLLYWLRGRYDFRANDEPPPRHSIRKRRLIAPLFARLCMLIVTIGSIALALPSEKRLAACSRGDYTVVQAPPSRRPDVVNLRDPFEVCTRIPLDTRLGIVRSSASYCSFTLTPGDLSILAAVASMAENLPDTAFAGASYDNSTGILLSLIFSSDRIEAIGSFVEWKTEDGDRFHSLLPFWNAERHLGVIADGVSSALGQECGVLSTLDSDDDTSLVAQLSCTFDASVAIRYVSAAIRESLTFEKEATPSLRAQSIEGSGFRTARICAVDVTVQRPLINIVPLVIGLLMAFVLNMTVMFLVSRHGNVMDGAFHIVREVLGHDTGANPLQIDTGGNDIENVALQKFLCGDGMSGHVGYVRGVGDNVVEDFDGRIRVGRCMQVACRGARFVCEFSKKGSEV